MTRDVFKSDSCYLTIPEIDLTLSPGTLDGIYTTVEGLIVKIHENLYKTNPFAHGDSQTN